MLYCLIYVLWSIPSILSNSATLNHNPFLHICTVTISHISTSSSGSWGGGLPSSTSILLKYFTIELLSLTRKTWIPQFFSHSGLHEPSRWPDFPRGNVHRWQQCTNVPSSNKRCTRHKILSCDRWLNETKLDCNTTSYSYRVTQNICSGFSHRRLLASKCIHDFIIAKVLILAFVNTLVLISCVKALVLISCSLFIWKTTMFQMLTSLFRWMVNGKLVWRTMYSRHWNIL